MYSEKKANYRSLILSAFLVTGLTVYMLKESQQSQSVASQTPKKVVPEVKTVNALGRLEAKGEVI